MGMSALPPSRNIWARPWARYLRLHCQSRRSRCKHPGQLEFFRVDKTKEIIAELKRSYAIELETIENFLANSIDLQGADAEPIRKSLEEEIPLKLKHARRLAKRINVLGGRLPGSLELARDQHAVAAAFR